MQFDFIDGLFVLMLATFIGLDVIRRVSRLLHTPLIIEKTTIVTTLTRPTMPSASARWSGGTKSDTCHNSAAVCMVDPENEISCPIQSRRKLRCWSATKDRLEIN